MKKIAVIGGGPAGMIAAGFASTEKVQVDLFEQNEKLGKKLYITGKGRCNLTSSNDISDFFQYIPRNPNFLYSALYSWSNEDVMSFFRDLGIPLKIERGARVFPQSDKSSDIIRALSHFLISQNVNIKLSSKVDDVVKCSKGFELSVHGNKHYYDSVIIATGGLSYPSTGSTGDGYVFARKLGHSITALNPGLVPIVLQDHRKELQGVSLRNIALLLRQKHKILFSEIGELLFTHNGISGPLALSASLYLSGIKNFNDFELYLDLKPGLTEEILNRRLLSDFAKYSNRSISNALKDLLIKSVIPVVLEKTEIKPELPVHQLTKEMRFSLIHVLKNFPLPILKLEKIELGIITTGGIDVLQVDPSTMESKIHEQLFFCGEILDVHGFTGGYNLQIAFSTGYLAGTSARNR